MKHREKPICNLNPYNIKWRVIITGKPLNNRTAKQIEKRHAHALNAKIWSELNCFDGTIIFTIGTKPEKYLSGLKSAPAFSARTITDKQYSLQNEIRERLTRTLYYNHAGRDYCLNFTRKQIKEGLYHDSL